MVSIAQVARRRRPDEINRATWASGSTLEVFAARSGAIDAGEAVLLARLAESSAGETVLDIGVGGGRTVPLLGALGGDYVAIDYLAEMVALTRERYPDVRVEHVDARDLSCFPDGSFGLVYWSANGIDGLGHDDRRLALAEIRRVLHPSGTFAFSTHNLDHFATGRTPWDYRWFWVDPRTALRRARRLPGRVRAYRRARASTVRGSGWAMLVDPAYEYGLLTHYASLPEALGELAAVGFGPEVEVYDLAGTPLEAATDTRRCQWFHLLVPRP